MRYSQEETELALAKLNENQKPIFGIIGAIVGAFVGLVFYVFIYDIHTDRVLIILMAVPPSLVGLFARFTGRVYNTKYRLPVGAIGALTYILGCLFLQLNPLAYLLTPCAFGVAMLLAKPGLGQIEKWAIRQKEIDNS